MHDAQVDRIIYSIHTASWLVVLTLIGGLLTFLLLYEPPIKPEHPC